MKEDCAKKVELSKILWNYTWHQKQ